MDAPDFGRRWRALAIVVAATPALITATLAWRYFLSLPVGDYWDVLNLYLDVADRELAHRLDYYWSPVVDQRMFFPKMAIHTLCRWFHNQHYGLEIALGFAAQILVLWSLLRLAPPLRAHTPRAALGLVFLTSALLFWPAALMRFQHHWYSTQYSLAMAPGLLALVVLVKYRGRWRGLPLALPLAVVAAYSHGTGATLSIALGVLLLVDPAWTWRQRLVWWAWVATCVVTVRLGMPSREALDVTPYGVILGSPIDFVRQVITCHAVPPWRLPVGSLLLALCGMCLWTLWRAGRLRSPAVAALAALCLWCFATATASILIRGCPGGQPAEHYHAFFVLFPVVVVHLYFHAAAVDGSAPARVLNHPTTKTALGVVLGVVYILGAQHGIARASEMKRNEEHGRRKLLHAPLLSPEDTRWLFPHDRFRLAILPRLMGAGLLPAEIGSALSGERVPLHIATRELTDMEATGAGAEGVLLTSRGPAPAIVMTLREPLPRNQVLILALKLPGHVRGRLSWRDRRGWHADRTFVAPGEDGRFRFVPGGFDWRAPGPPILALRFSFEGLRRRTAGLIGVFQGLEAQRPVQPK